MVDIDRVKIPRKWPLAAAGVAVLLYSIIVLGFVAKSRDLGLRCLLADDAPIEAEGDAQPNGVRIAHVMWYMETNATHPKAGDILLKIAGNPVNTFTEFTQELANLRLLPRNPPGASLFDDGDPNEQREQLLSGVAVVNGERWIDIEFRRPGEVDGTYKSFLKEKSLPLGSLSLSLVWFILQLGIFIVGAMAFWKRPFDSSARMFFTMCVVTLGAFVGGYHWWVIAARLWMNVPFTICAMLVPVVTLHFFLVFPHRKSWFAQHPKTILAGIYTLPLLATIGMVALLCHSSWMHAHPESHPVGERLETLRFLQTSVYGYLGIAGVYFFATLAVLYESYRETRNTAEHNQVKWISRAAAASILPVGYALWLAAFDKTAFAIGEAKIPMFIASLMFMMSYAVGIIRYKLTLVDQVFSRGMAYLVLSFSVLVVYSLAVTLSSVLGLAQDSKFLQQAITITPIVLVSVILLGWLRDRVQMSLDRRFYREKYQLDKVLRGMNQAVAHLVDPATLGQQMLQSCRDVLHVDHAALYLKAPTDDAFVLIAGEGDIKYPQRLTNDPEIASALLNNASLQRVSVSQRDRQSAIQSLLRELDVNLIHGLEMEGELAGIVLLGEKRSGDAFTAEDLTFLTALGQIMTLHSSKVHYEITRLNNELELKMERVAEQQRQISILQSEIMGSRQALPAPVRDEGFRNDLILGDSPAIHRVLETVRKVSRSESSVLIRGESGTGKELLAQTLHENSPRQGGPLVSVHCAALSPSLLESELFGHAKGAFTGAHRDREGRFEKAHGGTLFLDEIGDISLETQVKLLRVLQERAFEPVGAMRTIHVDVRLVTATHQDLEKLILEGKFREDLYYRLNVISITLPPLRERLEDIFELARYFLNRASQRIGKQISHVDDDAVAVLKGYSWPGNIRELENVMERAVVLADGEVIQTKDLPAEIVTPSSSQVLLRQKRTLKRSKRDGYESDGAYSDSFVGEEAHVSVVTEGITEQEQLLDALQRCDGNKARAARLLGMPRSTYYSRLKKHGLG